MARSAASNLILETGTNIADRYIRMTVDGSVVDATIPGSLSLDSREREDGWTAPNRKVEFSGAFAEALRERKSSLEKLGLTVRDGR